MAHNKFNRSAESLLLYDVDYDDKYEKKHRDDDDDDEKEVKNHNDGGNNHNDNHHNDSHYNENQNNNQKNNDNKPHYSNPVCKILYRTDKVFTRDDVIDLLVREDGLIMIVKDLKSAKKNNDSSKSQYVQKLLSDIVFASAIKDALKDVYGNKFDDEEDRKDLTLFMNELSLFLNRSYNDKFAANYVPEVIESMRLNYTNILYKFNKKAAKKMVEKVKGMTEDDAKKIAILTAGDINNSVYQLVKFLYRKADNDTEMFSTSHKNLLKLFKCAYGKNMTKAIIALMLEKVPSNLSDNAMDVSVNLDMVIRHYLNDLEKNEIHDAISHYIAARMKQEKNGIIPRRFGNRKTIHPDDFPKLIKVIEDIESKDFSSIQYLRK